MRPEVLVLATVAGLVIAGLLVLRGYPLLLRLIRRDDSLDTFKEHFSTQGCPVGFLEAAYAHFQGLVGVRDFPVRPTDRVGPIYGLADEDLVETLAELHKLAWSDETLPAHVPQIDTVEDAIMFTMASGSKHIELAGGS